MQLILTNEADEQTGIMEKMEAHRLGLLHRAFSIFILNDRNEILLHQRALKKYHSPGLWTNACCSHPQPGQSIAEAAAVRLQQEMGFAVPLIKAFEFMYKADVGNGLIENEYDHVYIGYYDGEINPDPEEVAAYRFATPDHIRHELSAYPDRFTAWFHIAFPIFEKYLDGSAPNR